jgi:5'-nucleotidase
MIRSKVMALLSVMAAAACGDSALQGDPALGAKEAAISRPLPMGWKQETPSRRPGRPAPAHNGCADHDGDDDESPGDRDHASRPVWWRHPHHPGPRGVVAARVLGFNDFHGRLTEGLRVANRPAGGAAVLASYLRSEMVGFEGRSLIVHAGDHVGATPPESALLQDEPAISFLNLLSNQYCRGQRRTSEFCNVVGTFGNHEFDEGTTELLRLINGRNHANGPFLENPWRGADYPYVSANVVSAKTGRPLVSAHTIVNLGGVRVGVIGAVLKETPTIVTPAGVAGLQFLDEITAINGEVTKLKRRGVQAILVTIHQGARQAPTNENETDPAATVGAPISTIVAGLDDEVDVVVSGHSHSFTNALLKNAHGVDILVTQAFSSGTAFAEIDLELDRATRDVVSKTARVLTTFSDQAPGDTRAADVQALVDAARTKVAPLVNQEVATVAADATRTATPAGEQPLGNLIADAQRAAMNTDFAFMNPGGIRADLFFAADPTNTADADGRVLWGELFTIQPFGNSLVRMTLTGSQIVALLEQQWVGQTSPRFLQISGLTYTWDSARPDGSKIVEVRKDGVAIVPTTEYSVTVNNFIAGGGDNFTTLLSGTGQVGGAIDLDALIDYMKAQPQPVAVPPLGRITRL